LAKRLIVGNGGGGIDVPTVVVVVGAGIIVVFVDCSLFFVLCWV